MSRGALLAALLAAGLVTGCNDGDGDDGGAANPPAPRSFSAFVGEQACDPAETAEPVDVDNICG
jgi:hypothetical protein